MSMILSTTTFAKLPTDMTIIKSDKVCNAIRTYDGVAFYSWGKSIVGKELSLTWTAMPATMFDAIDTVIAVDATCVFNPGIPGSTVTYEVNILSLTGSYFLSPESSAAFWRRNCELRLIIMSEVT